MTKNIWAGIIALVIVLCCGILEVAIISKRYKALADDCQQMMEKCKQNDLTEEEYESFRDKWVDLRELSEILLPHLDVYEINLRFAEGQAYVEEGDYEQLYAQFCVIQELLDYVPHLMKPSFKHIV